MEDIKYDYEKNYSKGTYLGKYCERKFVARTHTRTPLSPVDCTRSVSTMLEDNQCALIEEWLGFKTTLICNFYSLTELVSETDNKMAWCNLKVKIWDAQVDWQAPIYSRILKWVNSFDSCKYMRICLNNQNQLSVLILYFKLFGF